MNEVKQVQTLCHRIQCKDMHYCNVTFLIIDMQSKLVQYLLI